MDNQDLTTPELEEALRNYSVDPDQLVETVKAKISEMISRDALEPMLEECKKAEDAWEKGDFDRTPHFMVKLYRPCPGKTAIPFFHGATGPIVRGKVLFHGNYENPSIVSIPCVAFRKWVDWFRSRPTIDEMKKEIQHGNTDQKRS